MQHSQSHLNSNVGGEDDGGDELSPAASFPLSASKLDIRLNAA